MTTGASPRPPAPGLSPAAAGLYAGTVLIWSTTWLALKFQLGVVDPQVSLTWRFLIAAPVMFAICRVAGAPLRFPPRTHLRFAALGLFMFAANFFCMYHAGDYLVSGLLAVIFSLASVMTIGLSALVLGERLSPRILIGALIGLTGVAAMFLHEIDASALGVNALKGLAFGIAGSLAFSVGNIVAAGNRRENIPLLSANAWGMAYGVAINAAVALASGSPFIIEETPRYLLSLAWLAIPGTVLAFWMYVGLIERIGPDRAAYTTVLTPALALLVSTFAEDYRWSPLALLGLALVVIGNVLVLRRR
jgi:drug/metabolite transporter (DMT)-like permease